MKCIILAGGFATRLWPLSEKRAKPLLHLKDRPLLSHLVDQLPSAMEVIISVNKAFRKSVETWAKNQENPSLKIVVEEAKNEEGKLGALAAVAHAIKTLDLNDDLLLIAGDNYFGFKMEDFLASFRENPMLAAYDIGDLKTARQFGVVVAKNGQVTEFQEKPQEPKSALVSTGCFVFPEKNLKDILDYAKLKPDHLGGIFEYLLEKGERVDVFRFQEPWYDIGSFDAYLQANAELLGGKTIQEKEAKLEGENRFEGGVYLGKNVRIKNSILHDCIVLENAVIDDCVLRQCVIDENSRLKGIDLSHQMIRAGSRIEK